MNREHAIVRILDRVPIPAFIANPVTSKVLWVNRPLVRMYGAEAPDALVGTSMLDYIQAPQLDKALGDIARLIAGESPESYTYELRRANGEFAAGQVSAVPMRFHGQFAILGFMTDVSERERLLLELSESEERYRMLLDTMPSGLVVASAEGDITHANAALARALDCERSDLAGRPVRELFDAGCREAAEATRRDTLAGTESRTEPVVLVRADGRTLAATACWTVVHLRGGTATQTLLTDIAPRG